MALRRGRPVTWPPAGLTDVVDGTQSFPGACNLQANLIPAQNQKGSVYARVAAVPIASLPDYGGGPITCLFTVGNMCYGMYASATYSGHDRPFAYDLATGTFAPISGLSASNLPLSQPFIGAWQPPKAAQIGSRVLFTHPGFPGGSTANTFWVDSVANSTNGSATLTGYPFYYGIPAGSLLSDSSGAIAAGTTLVSQTIENINVLASGTATDNYITVASPTGIYPGQPVFLPNGQWDTVASVSGDNVTLNNITISNNFTNTNVTFATSTIVMSKPATATVTNLLLAATAPISNKFGWLDFSNFSVSVIGNIQATTQPIINGYFDVTGIQPGMTITGLNIPAGTTVRAVGSLTFPINMMTTTGSTSVADIWFPGGPSPASYLAGTLQPGQLVQGPGLAPGTTFVSLSVTVEDPYGKQISGSISAPAITGGTNQDFTVSASFIILSQLPTGQVNGASFSVAGGTVAAPLWGAGDTQGLALANVPVSVSEYGGSACFGVNTTSPSTAAEVISDAGVPCQVTNASQVLTFAGGVPITASFGLPLQNELGGIVQSLIVFQGASNLQQITGSPALGNVTVNTSQAATGTLAPNSVAATPKGLLFVAPDGLRLLDFSGVVHDPIGVKGDGIVNPFVCAAEPSRIAASFSGNVYRVTVTWWPPAFLQAIYGTSARTDEFWLHLDTGKFSGPHTCVVDVAAPWQEQNSFVCGLQAGRGQLWRSDPYPTPASSYVENGAPLSWQLRTVLLPDDATDEANALVEASIFGSMHTGASWAASLIDDQAQTQTTAEVQPAGSAITQSQLPLYWGAAAAFRQASIQLSGPSSPQTLIGAMRLRYQGLRYPLPAFPSYQEALMATPAGANVIDYGADPTGTKDSLPAFSAALVASSLVVVPPGLYKFSAALDYTVAAGASVSIVGAGSENSVLSFGATDGFDISLGSINSTIKISGLSFLTSGTGSGYGLKLTQTNGNVGGSNPPFNQLYDLLFRGSDGYVVADYWTAGLYLNGASFTNVWGCTFYGAFSSGNLIGQGILTLGNTSTYCIVTNVNLCNFQGINTGIEIGAYSQGIVVKDTNFTSIVYGINTASGADGIEQVFINNCQFGFFSAAAIHDAGGVYGLGVYGCFFLFPPSGAGPFIAIAINKSNGFVIIGNIMYGQSATRSVSDGVYISGYNSNPSMVSGNTITYCNYAVWIDTTGEYVNLQSNSYMNNNGIYLNSGSNNTIGGGST